VELGDQWADTQAAAAHLEEICKPLFARLTLDRMAAGGVSKAQAELEAYASKEYLEHVGRMVDAKQAANRARVRHQAALVWAELLRSANANRRAEMSMGSLTP